MQPILSFINPSTGLFVLIVCEMNVRGEHTWNESAVFTHRGKSAAQTGRRVRALLEGINREVIVKKLQQGLQWNSHAQHVLVTTI